MQKENAVKAIIGRVKPDVKISCHAELVSASSTLVVSQRQQQAWKIPYQVRDDNTNFTGVGPVFARPARTGAPLRSGFTLIELLVVVLIIGILAAVAVPQYQKAVWKSRYTQTKTLAKAIAQAEEVYYMANGKYALLDELSIELPATNSINSYSAHFKWGWCGLDISNDGRNDVQCWVRKNGHDYLGYVHNFTHSTWSNAGHTINDAILCVTSQTDTINSQICTAETGDSTRKSWGNNSYFYIYQN